MLRMLAYVFSNSTADPDILMRFSRISIGMMTTVVKPLGEALTRLPVTKKGKKTAGPTFGISRHIAFPPPPQIALLTAQEIYLQLVKDAETLAQSPLADHRITVIPQNFHRLYKYFFD